jgi:hypothetical protein
MGKDLKTGVQVGGGPHPGYRWNVWYVDRSRQEAMEDLTEEQYHIAVQFKELAREQDPTHPAFVSVDAVESFFELRDKGGVL